MRNVGFCQTKQGAFLSGEWVARFLDDLPVRMHLLDSYWWETRSLLVPFVYASPAYENEEEMSQILNLNSSLGPQSSDLSILTKFIHLNSAPGLCLPQALELKRRLCSIKDVL